MRVGLATFIRRYKLAPYLMLLPALAGIGFVILWPLVQMGIFSFQNYGIPQIDGSMPISWVGFANFTNTFRDPEFWLSLRISVLFALVAVPGTLIVGTIVGLLLNRLGKKMSTFVSTSALLAWATPTVTASVLFFWMFNPDGGLVDWTLARMPHWLVGNTDWATYNWATTSAIPAYTMIALLVIWQAFPFVAITVLAGLKTIPSEVSEAARVDGASPWRVFWRITFPLLKPIYLVLLLLSVIWDFGIFTQSYLITGGIANANEFNLSLYIYAKAFTFPPSWGLGGALALILRADLARGHLRICTRLGQAGGPHMTGGEMTTVLTTPATADRERTRSAARSRARARKRLRAAGVNGLGVLVALVTLFPIFWMISTAFKPTQEIFSLTPHLLPAHPTLGNFRQVISGKVTGGIGGVWLFFRNSITVTLATVLIASLIALLASVAVARFRFRLRTSFLIMLLIVQMIPGQALIIALFQDFGKLNLTNDLTGLVVVYSAQALPVTIWMLRNFVATIPKELEEAAAIDGATSTKIFWRILMPLVAPGLVATSIFAFITAYNEFIVALTFLGQTHQDYTLPIYVQYFYTRGRRGMGPDHGGIRHVHRSGDDLLPDRPPKARRRSGRGSSEGMTQELAADPALGRLADAVLIPPFPGPQAPDWICEALGEGLAGVTLFGPNVRDRAQVARLTTQLRAAAAEPVIAIDEEGGDVTRISHQTGSDYPGNAALGAVDDVELTRAVYAALGAELFELGISLNLAPTVDVNTAADNPVIGTRAFGADTALVARHAAAAVAGLQSAGVAACAKHFPGHGSTRLDSHHVIATVQGSLRELHERDLPPFEAAIKAGVRAIMPSHLLVPELTGELPASLSSAALTDLLRGELGFTGLIVSDGLEMRAVSEPYGIPEAAVLAVMAGTDLLCLGRDIDQLTFLAVRTALIDAVRSGRLPGERLEDAAARVAELRAWTAGAVRDRGPAAGWLANAGASRPALVSSSVAAAAASGRSGWPRLAAPCWSSAAARSRSPIRWKFSWSRPRTWPPGRCPGASARGCRPAQPARSAPTRPPTSSTRSPTNCLPRRAIDR